MATVSREQYIQAIEAGLAATNAFTAEEIAALREHAKTAEYAVKRSFEEEGYDGERCYCPSASIGVGQGDDRLSAASWSENKPGYHDSAWSFVDAYDRYLDGAVGKEHFLMEIV